MAHAVAAAAHQHRAPEIHPECGRNGADGAAARFVALVRAHAQDRVWVRVALAVGVAASQTAAVLAQAGPGRTGALGANAARTVAQAHISAPASARDVLGPVVVLAGI